MQDCGTILHVVDLRLGYPPHKWRNVYKASRRMRRALCCRCCFSSLEHTLRQALAQLLLLLKPSRCLRTVHLPQGLTLLEYLVRHGSEACVAQAKGGLAARLDSLASGFHYVAPDGRDMGSNVRHRCAAARLGQGCGRGSLQRIAVRIAAQSLPLLP